MIETNMSNPLYPTDKIKRVVAKLSDVKPIEPVKLSQEKAIEYMEPLIGDLIRKNYNANQIAAMIRENGVKVTVKEIKAAIARINEKIT